METAGPAGTPPTQPNHPDEGPPVRVLLVDDEKAYVEVLFNRLSKRGFQVTKSFDGKEALRVLRQEELDVVVLDLKMADLDGLEVLKIMKLLDPTLQVIMLTGHGSASACQQGLELGAYDYLMKPCTLTDLVKKIDAAYREKQRMAG
jgi:DNA-binding response OmpR family regulator